MTATETTSSITLPRDSNQALGIGRYACEFMSGRIGEPGEAVIERTTMFFTDSILCGLSALACRTNAPTILRDEAQEYPRVDGACCMGSTTRVAPEKAIAANASAVREWDSNGTNFGYNPELGHVAGEFGHNDFYAVPIAAAQVAGLDGAAALRGMICLDEIRGRLAEVFSLKSYKIDHVVHGAIASAAVYGAMLGATPEQIESAIGMTVAHYVPWRAIRAGHQLSDSKGASAAISTEVAILSMQRAMRGFIGPGDIFRNPEALWRQFEPTDGDCPFDLVLSHSGDDFAVMGMHFKLGLYEHQSAGALQGLIDLLSANPDLLEQPSMLKGIHITAFRCPEAETAYAALAQRIDGFDPPLQRRRDAPYGDGVREFRFRNIFSQDALFPEGRFIVIEHQTPEVIWQPALMTHPNGAVSFEEVVFCAEPGSPTQGRLEAIIGAEADGGHIALPGGGVATVLSPADYAARFDGAAAPDLPCAAAVVIGVDDMAKPAACLESPGITSKRASDGTLFVSADDANGGIVAFRPV